MIYLSIDDETVNVADVIETELLSSLAVQLPQSRNHRWVLAARDDQNTLVGGITAHTSYGWLLIKTLWVNQDFRRQGVGRRLVDAMEKRARVAGCHAAWLDTSSPDARRFYAELGYEIFGELANTPGQFPETHQRWFMKRPLTT